MKQIVLLPLLVLSFAFWVGTVSAQEESMSPRDAFKERVLEQRETGREELQDRAQAARTEALCTAVTARVNNRINWYEAGRDRHVDIYNRVTSRIEDLTDKLEARGCSAETTQPVRDNLVTMGGLVDEFTSQVDVLKGYLNSFRDAVCNDEPDDHSDELAQVQSQAAAVRAQTDEIRNYYLNTLRPSIRIMGDACKAERPTTTSSKEE